MSTDDAKTSAEHGENQLLDHVYDGIAEYDNPMPRWWVWMFWGSFWFSAAYLFHYWIGNGTSTLASYQADLDEANAIRAKEAMGQTVTEDGLHQLMADRQTTDAGKALFDARCSPCHLEGQGSIGPNLTDNHWIHGQGQLMDIFGTVSEGVLDKGMPAWSRQLTPRELRQVVAFVGTLKGQMLPGKAPEGTPIP